ncbi:MAG: hypothetical protein JWM19_6616 [Actinomycetia bacterium]|nr:hypothetical protein [Actinomycetes bacterium]
MVPGRPSLSVEAAYGWVPYVGVPGGVNAGDGMLPVAAGPNTGVPDVGGPAGALASGALADFGGGAMVTVVVGVSASAAIFAEATASAAPQAMQGPLCREFTVPQLLHFQVGTAMCRAILSGG